MKDPVRVTALIFESVNIKVYLGPSALRIVWVSMHEGSSESVCIQVCLSSSASGFV